MLNEDNYDKLLGAYYGFFQSPEGQIVLGDLQDKFYKTSLIPNRTVNADEILLNVGAREVVVYILSKVEEFEMQRRSH